MAKRWGSNFPTVSPEQISVATKWAATDELACEPKVEAFISGIACKGNW
jgi:hypothetical protein